MHWKPHTPCMKAQVIIFLPYHEGRFAILLKTALKPHTINDFLGFWIRVLSLAKASPPPPHLPPFSLLFLYYIAVMHNFAFEVEQKDLSNRGQSKPELATHLILMEPSMMGVKHIWKQKV